MKKIIIPITVMFLLVASCVSKKKYLELDEKLINTKASLQKTTIEKERLEAKFGSIEKRVENYNNKINSLRDENVTLERSNLGFTDDDITVLSEKQKEDLGGFTEVEQNILDEICEKNDVPKLLVSKLLHAEFDSQGMTKHSKIYPKLGKILSEEWRTYDEIETIKEELKEKKKKKKQNEQFSRETN